MTKKMSIFFFLSQVFPMIRFADSDELITLKIRVMSSVDNSLHE